MHRPSLECRKIFTLSIETTAKLTGFQRQLPTVFRSFSLCSFLLGDVTKKRSSIFFLEITGREGCAANWGAASSTAKSSTMSTTGLPSADSPVSAMTLCLFLSCVLQSSLRSPTVRIICRTYAREIASTAVLPGGVSHSSRSLKFRHEVESCEIIHVFGISTVPMLPSYFHCNV